eukprot:GFUD01054722.1.p1 GENE.GFUD01054722.1~~GFUD01054722.1.p1  ORF type:complete len:119 (+),score=33.58 GFUD01054722.1:254-610(+)
MSFGTLVEDEGEEDKEKKIKDSFLFQESTALEVNEPYKYNDLDTILSESVGNFGWFQVWLVAILFFCQATFATGVYTSVFTDYTPKHHCAQEELERFNLTKWKEESERCSLVSGDVDL